MINTILTKIFGSQHQRDVKKMLPIVAEINALEPQIQALSNEALRGKTVELRRQLADGTPLDDLLVPAFAVAREAAVRTLKMRPFDVQLMGGIVLHRGKISEMKTGEGKTLMATLPVYLNALEGKGVHVVTVNDYLARRDSDWMGRIYRFLGLSVGVIQHDMPDADRKAAYAADVTYGTNNELGFDYLRDNMKFDLESMVQRPHHYAIVDEVDSILIDEARTPLIISGPSEESTDKYYIIDRVIPRLVKGEEIDEGDGKKSTTGDYIVDEKGHSASLTDEGVEKVEKMLGVRNLYEPENMEVLHGVNQSLRAHALYQRDVDYLIKDGQVVIVDEFTGRMMPGRRWSDGLHQAVEAKEGVKIERENQTLATITFQNYFRMYKKLAGMTGTADTEASEFAQIYNLDVTVIPTNRDMIREDRADLVYRTAKEKWNAVVEEIRDCQQRGQPVLVGTVSIEKSEMLSKLLSRPPKVPHVVLNAKYHEREASIVAQAGRKGAVTIATNMAGRGTDIVLGGNPEGLAKAEADPETEPEEYAAALARYTESWAREREEVLAAGGLHILGTERHESRRIDNQLRGRSGRQGDPGASKFFVSLEDDLMRIFGSERMDSMLQKLGLKEGEAIIHPWINKALEKAQQKVEARNYEIRKQLLKYDDVMNDQRKVVYEQRKEIMAAPDVAQMVADMRHEVVEALVMRTIPENALPDQWEVQALHEECLRLLNLDLPVQDWAKEEGIADAEIRERILKAADDKMAAKAAQFGIDVMRMAEKSLLLQILDQAWKDHLLTLDHLRQGINLRAYAQRDPLNEYKREAFELFEKMLAQLRDTVTSVLSHVELRLQRAEDVPQPREPQRMRENREDPMLAEAMAGGDGDGDTRTQRSASSDGGNPWAKTPRNALCPCGSGKKYKHCHGRL